MTVPLAAVPLPDILFESRVDFPLYTFESFDERILADFRSRIS